MSFPRYAEYKDSGVEQLGEVPTHWTMTRMKRIARLLTERTDRRVRPVALENIASWSGQFIETEADFFGEGVAFESGDILFGKLRPYLAKVLLADFPGEAVGDFHVMRLERGISGRFVQYELLNPDFISLVDGSTFGARMPRASWGFMGGIELAAPPLPEQTAIAAFLDRETGKIDALVAEQEKLIALLKEKRQAVISHAVTKGLDPDAPMKLSGIEWLGDVPAHWEIANLKRFASRITDGAHISPDTDGGVYDFVSTKDVAEDGIDFDGAVKTSPASYEYLVQTGCKPRGGDVLFSKDGTVGRTMVVRGDRNFVVASSLIIISPDGDRLDSDFLNFLCMSETIQQQVEMFVKGAGLPRLSIQNLLRVIVLVPPCEEQRQIASFLSDELAKFKNLTVESKRAITLLNERRSALISAAVTGQIDVRDAAPAVEFDPPRLRDGLLRPVNLC